MNPAPTRLKAPPIPDHELSHRIAVGSYGSIWLARNVLGSFRAVKIVRRSTFKSERQYEREFDGVRHFEPISRAHPGFVHILHVGRNDGDGHFYYMMELADDAARGRRIQPATYIPRTLRNELDQRRRLPLEECLVLGQTLLLALEELHERGLVHRDIKPANFIYVEGVPKVADIGTVAAAGRGNTPVGSVGYNPPEGSGRPAGDVFSFGRVLYEMFSGVHVQELHDALPDLRPRLKDERQRRFYDIIQQACHPDPLQRPSSMRQLRESLSALLPLNDADAGTAVALTKPPVAATTSSPGDAPAVDLSRESYYGAVAPESPLYVRREADAALERAQERRAGVIFITGSPQTGKTSLLARALHRGRARGARAVFTDLQKLNAACFESLQAFYHALGESMADQLDLPVSPRRVWDSHRTPNANFDRFIRREALAGDFGPVVWGLDEVARIRKGGFADEFCGFLRAWCNERALEPQGSLARLTLILAGPPELRALAAEGCPAALDFGEHVTLPSFSRDEFAELNRRCGSPLRTPEELDLFHQLVSGQPFLCRYGLLRLARRREPLDGWLTRDPGWHREIFAEPLQRLTAAVETDGELRAALQQILVGSGATDASSFTRLQRAGLVAGESAASSRIACGLYAAHFRQQLAVGD
jgi:hypothetical protein